MELKALNESYLVTGQIAISDVEQLLAQGFTAVVCNRPDNEAADQPLSTDIKAACLENGLAFYHIPMVGSNFTAEDVTFLKDIIAKETKVLGFCRTGNRSSILWNAAQSV